MVEIDEQANKTNDTGKEVGKDNENVKPLSIVEEAKAIRDEIVKAKDELKEERTKLEKIQAENLLGSSAGGHIEAQPPKEDTPEEYVKKAMSGEIKDVKG